MDHVQFYNGVKMPCLGFGVYHLTEEGQCERAVTEALQAGYRMIDTAAFYGNEKAVGAAVRKSGIPREEIFITSKLWVSDISYEGAKKAFPRTLSLLGLEYLDLYLIHQPFNDYYGAWRALEEFYEEGKIRAIGVSNFYPDRLIDLTAHNQISPMVNQLEVNPFYQRHEEQKIMEEMNIKIEAWSPLAAGKDNLFTNPVLLSIGKKYGKTAAQVTLRWLVQRGIVPLPRSSNAQRIQQNCQIFDFSLTEEDMKQIASLDTGKSCFYSHRDPAAVRRLTSMKLES